MEKSSKKQSSNSIWDVVVIGGGASGMMAAARAGAREKRVLLLEKNESLGKKLLITGGGRCNVTNNKTDTRLMLSKYKDAGKFLFSSFSQFGVKETISFFESHGIALKEENEGRMFPITNTSQSIWNVLTGALSSSNAEVQSHSAVSSLLKKDNVFNITLQNGKEVLARTCIVATGGTSHPETGSTGDAFVWLKKLGHSIIENNYALVPLKVQDPWVKKLGGLTLPDIKLTVYSDTKKVSVQKGKILFTHFGISGPTILNISKQVGDLLAYSRVTITLDLFPDIDHGSLRIKLQELLVNESNKKLKNALSALMPAALVVSLLELGEVSAETPCHSVLSEDRTKLIALFKEVPLTVKGLLGANKAVISGGGIPLNEVDVKTMESKIAPGLYLVGDVLNIDRPSGGYSLQLCWTTGFVAGEHVH